jgi:DNA-directed RNA polymerase specialized sigma24 family protein
VHEQAALRQGVSRAVRRPVASRAGARRAGPGDQAKLEDSLSMAFLVLLESLTPVERGVFLLREVFDYEYAEIASLVEKSEAISARSYAAPGSRWPPGYPASRAPRSRRNA